MISPVNEMTHQPCKGWATAATFACGIFWRAVMSSSKQQGLTSCRCCTAGDSLGAELLCSPAEVWIGRICSPELEGGKSCDTPSGQIWALSDLSPPNPNLGSPPPAITSTTSSQGRTRGSHRAVELLPGKCQPGETARNLSGVPMGKHAFH